MRFILIASLALLFAVKLFAQQEQNCFSILAGCKTTADGSVILAHNEDDFGEQVVNFFRVPAGKLKKGYVLETADGAPVPLPSDPCGYLWLEMPGMSFSDSYLNDHGVVIASDLCPSREDNPELENGGIGYLLRHIMAQCSRTAKDAVRVGGRLVEQYGYTGTGRTYCIADPREAWMMSVVNGKHWVAQRIPDDHVALIPNYYTIGIIDLADTVNFLASPGLIEYAAGRGWFNPEITENFVFREVFGSPQSLRSDGNTVRHIQAYETLTGLKVEPGKALPFSFRPADTLKITDFFRVLRTHGENTSHDLTGGYKTGSPHSEEMISVCATTTQYGFVAQLRKNMPVQTGALMWIAPYRPCVQQFIPWYLGVTEIPEGLNTGNCMDAFKDHFRKIDNYNNAFSGHHFRKFQDFARNFDKEYSKQFDTRKKAITVAEEELIGGQAAFEAEVNLLLSANPEQALLRLNALLKEQSAKTLSGIDQK